MAKTPGQRGEFGRWLEAVRSSRYDTQAKALADMDRLAGLRIAPSEYAQWESGSRVPRADNPKVARLYEFFGSRPEPVVVAEPMDQSAVVAAIDRLTEAVTAALSQGLVRATPPPAAPSESDATPYEAEFERLEGELRALRALVVSHHPEPAAEGRSGRPAPRETAV